MMCGVARLEVRDGKPIGCLQEILETGWVKERLINYDNDNTDDKMISKHIILILQ